MNTPFFQVPTLECGHGAGARVQGLVTLYSGTKVGTGSLFAHNFCKFRAVHCFVLAAKLMFQYRVWQGVTMYTVAYIGYSKCEHNTILCRYPGSGSQAPSVNSPTEKKSALLKQNNKEEKEIMPLSWHIPALNSVYFKRSSNEKRESHTKPATTLPNFWKNHLLFPTRKENHGKGHAC